MSRFRPISNQKDHPSKCASFDGWGETLVFQVSFFFESKFR